jgi:mono/diheme cytochrome c family protein
MAGFGLTKYRAFGELSTIDNFRHSAAGPTWTRVSMLSTPRKLPHNAWSVLGLLVIAFARVHAAEPPISPQQAEFFESKVRPVLVDHCQSCHGPKKQQGGLRLDSRQAALQGSDSGPVIKPGDPDASRLLQAVRQGGQVKKMPPKGKLKPEAVDALAAWVKMGAPWPDDVAARPSSDAWKRHWAFQPVRKPALPEETEWAKTPIDRLILASLRAKGLNPSPAADKRTLVRRAYFDLIGLPPTSEEMDAALADQAEQWFEKIVDKLLASPHYGERWGRYWLDVARYADNKGYVLPDLFEDPDFAWAYTYRDYVVRSFNEDLPYDRFIVEQLAADRLQLGTDRRPLTALGFLTVGGRFMGNPHDIIDDRIDVVSRGLMGIAVSCARCHDHKFDPIPSKDYYSLYGVFASSPEPVAPPLFADPSRTEAYIAFERELELRERRLREFVLGKYTELLRSVRRRVAEYLLAAYQLRDQPDVEDFMFVADGNELNPRVIHRWQLHLQRTKKQHDPVFAVWHAFADLPEKEFESRAAVVAKQLATPQADRPINQRVADSFVQTPPKSMADVIQRYAILLQQVDRDWLDDCDRAMELLEDPPARLTDPAAEELRQVLYGPESPPMVPLAPFGDLDLLPDRASQAKQKELRKALDEWRVKGPGAPPRAMTLEDSSVPHESRVFIRGNPNNLGERVPRQFLGFLDGASRRPFTDGSGRLELARRIADPNNRLTARVLVNRVWMYHFGSPLVATPSDFGLRSQPPTHPELLDYLAVSFVENGWSIKKLHRQIMLSNAYRQASADRADGRRLDPENALLWRMNRRRLDFEATRDALLATANSLDRSIGGPPTKDILGSNRRTLYGYVDRLNVPGLYRTFDYPSPDATSPRRDTTTVAPQSLFLMNHPSVARAAKKLLERPDVAQEKEPPRKVERLYRILYGRAPTQRELSIAQEYLAGNGTWERYAHALLMANEFVFVD